ncbi:aspartyl-phosphate phosphatase Spo0E family protein [Paenibacillus sp. sgz302251]|uniref:aspartyl-phosphate phosphatase Spo0E family protein n=1 Tax=Paenibacillus sp. sgz302251 TaxID=3414493 RepID=UPI003C7E0C32
MHNCTHKQQIEEVRAEMVRVYANCNSFTDHAVVQISQKLDLLLNEYAYCIEKQAKRIKRMPYVVHEQLST